MTMFLTIRYEQFGKMDKGEKKGTLSKTISNTIYLQVGYNFIQGL